MSAMALTFSQGNWPVSSSSRATGAIASRPNRFTRSRRAMWSAVRYLSIKVTSLSVPESHPHPVAAAASDRHGLTKIAQQAISAASGRDWRAVGRPRAGRAQQRRRSLERRQFGRSSSRIPRPWRHSTWPSLFPPDGWRRFARESERTGAPSPDCQASTSGPA